MTTTENASSSDAGVSSEAPSAPAIPGVSHVAAPASDPVRFDPMDCEHIRTGVEQVGLRPEGQSMDKGIAHAADWVSRNAPALYTFAQALQILKGLFGRH